MQQIAYIIFITNNQLHFTCGKRKVFKISKLYENDCRSDVLYEFPDIHKVIIFRFDLKYRKLMLQFTIYQQTLITLISNGYIVKDSFSFAESNASIHCKFLVANFDIKSFLLKCLVRLVSIVSNYEIR